MCSDAVDKNSSERGSVDALKKVTIPFIHSSTLCQICICQKKLHIVMLIDELKASCAEETFVIGFTDVSFASRRCLITVSAEDRLPIYEYKLKACFQTIINCRHDSVEKTFLLGRTPGTRVARALICARGVPERKTVVSREGIKTDRTHN